MSSDNIDNANVVVAADAAPATAAAEAEREMPLLFLSHCAPILLMDESNIFGRPNNCHFKSVVADWYRALPAQLDLVEGARRPKAIVMLSAHWETSNKIRVTSQDRHKSLLYDYYGFPKFTYDVTYPAPGSTKLATRIVDLLNDAGVPAEHELRRDLDHAAFIPLLLMYPEADIPVLEISMLGSFDPAVHLRLGHALQALRREGVLLVGSGQASHGAFDNPPSVVPNTQKFVDALTAGLTADPDADPAAASTAEELLASKRGQTIVNWRKLPYAALAHPRPDHFMPIALPVGAARAGEKLTLVGDHWITGMHSLRTLAIGDVGASKKNKVINA